MWMKIGFIILTALVFSTSAIAQERCADRDLVIKRLSVYFGEVSQFIGLTTGGAMMEVWGSKVTGTWSITITQEPGITCFLATGELFTIRDSEQDIRIRNIGKEN